MNTDMNIMVTWECRFSGRRQEMLQFKHTWRSIWKLWTQFFNLFVMPIKVHTYLEVCYNQVEQCLFGLDYAVMFVVASYSVQMAFIRKSIKWEEPHYIPELVVNSAGNFPIVNIKHGVQNW